MLGEAVHFIDFMQYMVGAAPVSVFAQSLHSPTADVIDSGTVVIHVRYADGSMGTMSYLSNGDKSLGRERIEVFCDTPWHVKQPQAKVWDPSMSDEEVLADVEARFRDEPEFSPMADYRARRAVDFGER